MSECNNDSMRKLQERLLALEERLARLESKLTPSASPPPPSATSPETPPASAVAPLLSALHKPETAKPDAADHESAPTAEDVSPKRSLEEKIGRTWMLLVGVAVMLLGGVFFLKFAYDQGWINPVLRVITVSIAGGVILLLGEWAFRRKQTYFAAGMFGAGIVVLYYTSWAASPNGWYYPDYKMLSSAQAFGVMCAVTLLGIALAMRSGLIVSAIIALLGALATPVLMSSGENRQVELMSYLLLVDAGFLALAFWKRFSALAPIALAGTILLFAAWANAFADEASVSATLAFGWSFFGLFALYVSLGRRRLRAGQAVTQSILLVTGLAMITLLVGVRLDATTFLWSVFILDVLVLGICQYVRWQWPRFVVFAWTVFWLYLMWPEYYQAHPSEKMLGFLKLWSQWAVCYFVLFTADILARPFQKSLGGGDRLETVLALLVTGEGFLATYMPASKLHPTAMGALALGYAVVAFGIFCVLRKVRDWPMLREGYLAAALGLLLLAVPLHFDDSYVTVSWAAMGLALMIIAKWRGGKLLLAAPLAAAALATVHLGTQLESNPFLRETAFALGGAEISYGFLSVVGLTLGLWIMAGVLSVGKDVVNKAADFFFVVLLMVVGVFLVGVRAVVELPPLGATGCWLAGSVVLLIVGMILRRSLWLRCATVWLVVTAAKWVLHDTPGWRMHKGIFPESMVLLNWQFLLGLALAAVLLAVAILARRDKQSMPPALILALIVLSPLLVLWGGSFEVVRYVELHSASLHEPDKALQMGLSLWWAVWAGGMLIAGFIGRISALRYTAIVLFGVTLAKVLLVDMRDVDAGYRILTFLGVGGLLVAASWLYHRFFRAPKQDAQQETSS